MNPPANQRMKPPALRAAAYPRREVALAPAPVGCSIKIIPEPSPPGDGIPAAVPPRVLGRPSRSAAEVRPAHTQTGPDVTLQ